MDRYANLIKHAFRMNNEKATSLLIVNMFYFQKQIYALNNHLKFAIVSKVFMNQTDSTILFVYFLY